MLIYDRIYVMSKKLALPSPEQDPLFNPDEVVVPEIFRVEIASPPPKHDGSLSPDKEAEFDRLDSQGMRNARQIGMKIGEITVEFGKDKPKPPVRKGPRPSRSRKGFSHRELRIADGPPEGYDGR